MRYICSECGIFATPVREVDILDSGQVLTCRECSGETVVDLDTPEDRTARYAAANKADLTKIDKTPRSCGTEAQVKRIASEVKQWMGARHAYKGNCSTWDELSEDCNCEDLSNVIKACLTESYKAPKDCGTEAWIVALRLETGPLLTKALATGWDTMADLFATRELAEDALRERKVGPNIYDVRRVVVYWSDDNE